MEHNNILVGQDEEFKGGDKPRFIFRPGEVEDLKYNRGYQVRPEMSFVVLWDGTKKEYLMRDIYGKKWLQIPKNFITTKTKTNTHKGILL